MPALSEFYGIQIRMYYKDTGPHNRPHFHAAYQDDVVSVAIDDGTALAGYLPRRQINLVQDWLKIHREELRKNWERVLQRQPLHEIDPLN
jgi:hypothetical protein